MPGPALNPFSEGLKFIVDINQVDGITCIYMVEV